MKLTPWYPGDVQPARPGVYERNLDMSTPRYAKWDGEHWYVSKPDPQAASHEGWLSSATQSGVPWRGHANPPIPQTETHQP